MVPAIRASTPTEGSTASALTNGTMVQGTMGCGMRTGFRELASTLGSTAEVMKESGMTTTWKE